MTVEKPPSEILWTRLGGCLVALDSRDAEAIEQTHGVQDEVAIDLAELLALRKTEGGPEAEPRIVVRIAGGRGKARLIAGAKVALSALDPDQLQELPPFLAGLRRRGCIRALVSLGEAGLGYLLDVDAILERVDSRQSTADSGESRGGS